MDEPWGEHCKEDSGIFGQLLSVPQACLRQEKLLFFPCPIPFLSHLDIAGLITRAAVEHRHCPRVTQELCKQ